MIEEIVFSVDDTRAKPSADSTPSGFLSGMTNFPVASSQSFMLAAALAPPVAFSAIAEPSRFDESL